MTEAKSVIFTADDFGASPEVNAGILRAHREGVLRGTSLMVGAPARDAAVAAARECPGLDVGLHLVVCKGQSVLPPARLGALVDAAGRFVDNPVRGGMRYFFRRGLRAKIADECRAQIETHLELVGYLNHIDGHLNFHVHPVICDILLDLAAEYRVPCIRLPREPVFTTLALARDNAPRKLVEAIIFRALSRRARRKMTERGIRSTDWLFGLHQSGNLSERYMLDVIARLGPGLTEIYTHPAADLGGIVPPAAAQREVEILTSPLLPIALKARGARLTNFAELARAGGGRDAAPSQDVAKPDVP
ncbi:MAG TPA: hopanoid biosynthesis-associated protein HpnK [Candidatus Binataceae bacterium]|nr:hopanoid biosynthesis-associated protein HpnK [Candidatus Binataceae bacterium]